ncbi:FAD-binding protein [Nocardia sp. SYP-A9097]|uniref:FAD-binding oxidoreductase n=1 Tax=Nocardia sp. SYP-A9097 TaxID=2663237 RepID=UPI00129B282C|nr:FAD-binding oxidoreductase [Nocardia sp. SYP-A9097]MRH86757.1 FAD-binding protein [Nocardia sp. SYP-A9097]
MSDLSRRDVLRASVAAGVGAVVVPGHTAANTPDIADGSDPGESSGCPPATLTGHIVRPSDASYTDARLGWDQLFSHYPLVIVFAQETQDVMNALTWARQHNVALRVRSGRHALEGWSNVDNGIVIDVSRLKSVQIDPGARIATVGAGLNQLEAVTALAKQNLAVTTGSEGSVGLSGATLGGGLGPLNRWLGMACDSLIAAEVVVPSDHDCVKVINADLQHCSDLLWALRGAGNGNFGIVTQLTYKVYPLISLAYVQATWDGLGDLYGVFEEWQRTVPFADNRLGSELEIDKSQILLSAWLAEGSAAQAKEMLAPILSVGTPDVTVQVGNWGDIFAGAQPPLAQEPANSKFFSEFVKELFPKKAIDIIGDFMRNAPTEESNYFVDAFGGAIKREPRGGTAFVHRDALFYGEIGAVWGTRSTQPGVCDPLTSQAQAWTAEFGQALRPYTDGAYVNVPNVGMQEWETAYWGRQHFEQLRRIKAKYDPHNVFQYEQSIPPASQ